MEDAMPVLSPKLLQHKTMHTAQTVNDADMLCFPKHHWESVCVCVCCARTLHNETIVGVVIFLLSIF